MIFNTHTLNETLIDCVESIFHFKGFMPDHSIERVVPTGHLFLLFELDGMTRQTFNNESVEPIANFKDVWISGMHKNFISISAHENSEMLVIQFKADGAYPFIHQPIEKFNETVAAAEHVFGDAILHLKELILKAESSVEKFATAESWLLSRFDKTQTPPNEFSAVVKRLQSDAASEYQEVVNDYPFTQKHLIDQFKKYVGLTPKYYQRILRFNDILQQIQQKQQISWSDVAFQCGFADQSHFIKEFRHFSGFNPTEFLSNEFQNDESNFFPLDRHS